MGYNNGECPWLPTMQRNKQMIIDRNMPIEELAELMGELATTRQAYIMLDLLVQSGAYDTDDISDEAWLDMLDEVADF